MARLLGEEEGFRESHPEVARLARHPTPWRLGPDEAAQAEWFEEELGRRRAWTRADRTALRNARDIAWVEPYFLPEDGE